jgi:cytochrome c553
MQRLRSLILIAAFAGGAVLALLRQFQGSSEDAGHAARRKRRGGQDARRWMFRIAGILVVLGFAGFLLVVSGIMPIKASSGHWTITAWFLNFAMRRSVVTHSLTTKVPSLDNAGLVAKGATHYEFGCRPCHGGPNIPQPVIAQRMTPQPPYLPRVVAQWRPKELFYIVKHGVKFTGMPAWPAQQRDDEVWAMVAFLQKLPHLTTSEYYELARGKTDPGAAMDELSGANDPPPAVIESCVRCHGRGGIGRGLGAFPILAGQRPTYLFASLLAYARGERLSGIMQPIAAGLSREAMSELAHYYAAFDNGLGRKTPNPKSPIKNPKLLTAVERGREIALKGIPSQRLPACAACHGPGSTPRNPIYPELAGQYPEYLALQLALFRKESRGGTPYAHLMHLVASRLRPEQINDVTLYYGSIVSSTGAAR